MKEKPSNYPRVCSTNFPDGFNKVGEKCFVPWSDFLLMQEAFEKAKKVIDLDTVALENGGELIKAHDEYRDALEKLEEAKNRK